MIYKYLTCALYYFVAHVSFAFIFRCFLNVCCCSKRMEILIYSIFFCPEKSNLNKFLHVQFSRLLSHDACAQWRSVTCIEKLQNGKESGKWGHNYYSSRWPKLERFSTFLAWVVSPWFGGPYLYFTRLYFSLSRLACFAFKFFIQVIL